MRTIEDQLRAYARYADDTLPRVDPIQAISAGKVREMRQRPIVMGTHPRPRVGIVLAAAALVIAGAIVLTSFDLLASPSDPDFDLANIPGVVPSAPERDPGTWPTSLASPGGATPESITVAPLLDGADIAFTEEGLLIVVSGDQQRLVARGSRLRGPHAELSPDGRYVAYATVPYTQDRFFVVDLTTGKTILDEYVTIPRGGAFSSIDAQTNDFVWSADSRHLVQLVRDTPTHLQTVIRVWEVGNAETTLVGSLSELPGYFIGLSPDGLTIAADSDGLMAVSGVVDERWSRTSITAIPPGTMPKLDELAFTSSRTYRWSPDGQMIAWIGVPEVETTVELGLVSLTTAEWSSQSIPDATSASLVGWSSKGPIIERTSTRGAVDIITISPAGEAQVLTTLNGLSGVSVAQNRVP